MKIFEIVSPWVSHQKAAEAYRRGMRRLGVEFTGAIEHANVLLVHGSPPTIGRIADSMRSDDPPLVAFTTWETTRASPEVGYWLAKCAAVITPSEFCRRALAQQHPNVRVVPHIIERCPVDETKQMMMNRVIGKDARFTFLNVTNMSNPRKNMKDLLGAFAKLSTKHPKRFRLIIKDSSERPHTIRQPGVSILSNKFTDLEMASLYSSCDCYISLHHSEGWGLPITEAMAADIPVIATGYSGNMEYMTANNSALVPYKESFIKIEAGNPWGTYYQKEAKWAVPDVQAAVQLMAKGRELVEDKDARLARRNTVDTFSMNKAAKRMVEVLLKVAR